jgi:hypothetical protein
MNAQRFTDNELAAIARVFTERANATRGYMDGDRQAQNRQAEEISRKAESFRFDFTGKRA